MPFSPDEQTMWTDDAAERSERPDDRAINERYVRGEGRIVIESNREKLPGFVNQLKDPDYMDLRPFYQRRPRWDVRTQSLLIESFVMNIPVPPVFLYERDFNSYEVMDGQQRITALRDFYANTLKLRGLETWPELNGRYYSTLPDKIRAGIDRRSITSIVLLKESTGSEEEASLLRETVFDRLNTGGIKLERQEIRNALYRGEFNDMIHQITRTDEFRSVWGLPRWVENEIEANTTLVSDPFFAKMGDAEVVLRFFALRHADHYRNGMQGFLDLYMRRAAKFSRGDVAQLSELYEKTLSLALDIYGQRIFRPYSPEREAWDTKPHRAFQDAVMIGLSEVLRYGSQLVERKSDVLKATKRLFIRHPDGAFTGRANTKQDLKDRIDLYRAMLRDILA
ncbi:DUF262 domain-containing protein [Rhizobiales bacterium RZME27]|uniref:DUF262 domain-containing protein n=1 Tax=Endobacterium cereale TaxID=2663029 RepID=A0A6A8A434_9HYPH|nr:DUF262 domain-containing protein [Endobacterium cereale]MQY45955.1 DUF262 domain-containing protein [Endobacterium cereale]